MNTRLKLRRHGVANTSFFTSRSNTQRPSIFTNDGSIFISTDAGQVKMRKSEESPEEVGVEVLPALSPDIVNNNLNYRIPDNLGWEYDPRHALTGDATEGEWSTSTAQVDNTRPCRTPGKLKEGQIFHDTMSVTSAESSDSYDLQDAFQLFTKFVTNKVSFRRNTKAPGRLSRKNRRSITEEQMGKMVFM